MMGRRRDLFAFILIGAWFATAPLYGQKHLLHIDVQAGYEYFPRMSRPSGWNADISSRWGFTDRIFATLRLHGGINRGYTDRATAGGHVRQSHNMEEYMLGVGPGIYLYNKNGCWIYAEISGGYGWGEKTGIPSHGNPTETTAHPFRGAAAALRAGIEKQVGHGHILGIVCGANSYIGEGCYPTVAIKYGVWLDL